MRGDVSRSVCIAVCSRGGLNGYSQFGAVEFEQECGHAGALVAAGTIEIGAVSGIGELWIGIQKGVSLIEEQVDHIAFGVQRHFVVIVIFINPVDQRPIGKISIGIDAREDGAGSIVVFPWELTVVKKAAVAGGVQGREIPVAIVHGAEELEFMVSFIVHDFIPEKHFGGGHAGIEDLVGLCIEFEDAVSDGHIEVAVFISGNI